MKAVILAGGEGTRLRPLSLHRPKPMVPLLDRPVLAHIISLLKSHGITDICATLQYRPDSIRDYFGDGSAFGVSLTYFIENTPLGTAGSVKACADFLGDEDFLVISGDAVCNFDLSACADFHRQKKADATLILYRHETPLEYGLVMTDEAQKITQFVEKPAWGQVCTNTINTGIYVLNPNILELVPQDTPFDFGKDLFPALLKEQRPMYGYTAEGYWCDIGDCRAYLHCMEESLDLKTGITPDAPEVRPGIWSASPLPENVDIEPPCYIGHQVTIASHAQIGPYTMLGDHSSVGSGSKVERSLLEAARIGDKATLYGAILYRGASVGDGAILNEGVVIGEDSHIGDGAIVQESSRIWPNQAVPSGAKQNGNLTAGSPKGSLQFGDGGVFKGAHNLEITPEFCLSLGATIGASEGPVSIGWTGGNDAQNLADALACGVRAAGGTAVRHDGGCESAAAWLARTFSYPRSLFVRSDGKQVFIRCLGADGLPLSRSEERKIEGLLLRGEQSYAAKTGSYQALQGIPSRYIQAAVNEALRTVSVFRPFSVSVKGQFPEAALLTHLFERLDCAVEPAQPGIPIFQLSHGGLRLSAIDEAGVELAPHRLLTLLCQIAFRQGHGAVAVPPEASAAIELAAEPFGAQVFRLGRDGKLAEALYARQIFLRDALFGAAYLSVYLGAQKQTLHAIAEHLPKLHTEMREIPLSGSRGAIMEQLAQNDTPIDKPGIGTGLRFETKGGHVYITPLIRRAAVRIMGEGPTAELASELCDFYTEKIKKADETASS